MTMPRTATLAAALLVTLTGAAQPQGERFRYLGRAGEFAVLATEATGPQNERRITVIAANSKANGPKGSDNAVLVQVIDCTTGKLNAVSATAYLGDDQLFHAEGASTQIEPTPGSPNELSFGFACKSEVPEGPAIWVEGMHQARGYALAQVKTN